MCVFVKSPIFIFPKRNNAARDCPITFLKKLLMRRKKPLISPRIQLLFMQQFEAVREEAKTEARRDQLNLLQILNPHSFPYVSKWRF